MLRLLVALISAALAVSAQTRDADLAPILSFEIPHPGGTPAEWGGGPAGTIFLDGTVVHGGRWAARLERSAASSSTFTSLTKVIPMDFSGATIMLRGYVRTENVHGWVGLWMREDADSGMVAFDNMQTRQLKGTTDWAQYSISLPVRAEAKQLFFGFLLSGTGKAWVDDLELLVDGKPIWQVPKAERLNTVLDTDHEFDKGSGIALNELTNLQIENLAVLGKVWGFLKYHHPQVTAGRHHWDYELFRVMPGVLAARDRAAANTALLRWIGRLGEVTACESCAKLDESNLHLRPRLDWIADQALLGTELSLSLRSIHRNRPAGGKQFYVSLAPMVGNPSFDNEAAYGAVPRPDAGFQLLALFRFWNIVEYWFPYRDVIGEDWDKVLTGFIPRIALAKTGEAYQRELMAAIARAHDTHANLWSSLHVRPPTGACQLPVVVRFIEKLPVVAGYSAAEAGKATGLMPGDVITALDGVPAAKLIQTWAPYYAASNEPTRLRDIARSMTRGACGESKVGVRRDSEAIDLTVKRLPLAELDPRAGYTHDLPGDTFRLLSDKVAYLKLSSVKIAEAARYIEAAKGTAGLIIDIRNYPSEFMVFALGSRLVEKPTEFVRFTNGDLANPGAFHWTKPVSVAPQQPQYPGKIVILVDETTLSSAEYTSMAFRAAPRAKVLGSTTAAADGNVSAIPLPGGLRSMISGIGVFYPDKRPTQRVGIVPDVEVKPTIAGIRAGRDEVLEAAVRQIVE